MRSCRSATPTGARTPGISSSEAFPLVRAGFVVLDTLASSFTKTARRSSSTSSPPPS